MKRNLNVVVADSHPIFLEGLIKVLKTPNPVMEYNNIGVAKTGNQLLVQVKETKPDLVIFDINLPETDVFIILPIIRKELPNGKLLVLTAYDDPKLVKAAFKAGVDGYLLKTSSVEELTQAIEEVLEGNAFLGRGVEATDKFARGGNAGYGVFEEKFAKKYALTKREMEVLRYIGQAMSNKDISEKIYISDQTVSVHRKNIMRKIGVNNSSSLIKIVYENNLA